MFWEKLFVSEKESCDINIRFAIESYSIEFKI